MEETVVCRAEAQNPYHALLERGVVQNLDGEWRFKADPEDVGETEGWFESRVSDRVTIVPGAWQAVFEDLRDYIGSAWYEREFTVLPECRGDRIAVVFCAVDYYSKVWVNGKLAGEHEGGNLPFSIDVSRLVRFGESNRITVKVTDPEDQSEIPCALRQTQVHRVSGIWRNVWIEATGGTYVSDIYVAPDVDACLAKVQVEVSSPDVREERWLVLRLLIEAPDGEEHTGDQRFILPKSDEPFSAALSIAIPIEHPTLWTLESPELYRIAASIVDGETTVDSASTDFGMRKIDVEGIHIRLNNKPIFLLGALDCPDAPDKNVYLPEYRPLTDEDIKRELTLAKEMGLNVIRKAVEVEDHRYLYWADRIGILIYGEPDHYPKLTETSRRRWRELLEGVVRRDRNHPSVLLWGLFNESWGLAKDPSHWMKTDILAYREDQAQVVEDAYELVKSLDDTRPVIDNSGGTILSQENFTGNHLKTDIDDIHSYWHTVPQNYRKSREYYASIRALDKPLIITEIGGYLYFPDMDKIKRRCGGKTPWPLMLPAGGWGEYSDMGAGYEERFYKWGLDKVYGGFARFAERHEWYAFHDMKDEIEQVRKNPEITGYVLTQFNSLGPYVHGLLDYYLDRRVFHKEMARIQQPDLVIIDWTQLNFWSSERFRANLVLSHYSDKVIRDAVARWWLEGFEIGGAVSGVSIDEVGSKVIGGIAFRMPAVVESTKTRVVVELSSGEETISRNYVEVYVFPESHRIAGTQRKINLYGARPVLKDYWKLGLAGYDAHWGIDPQMPVTVSTVFDDQVDEYLAGGGTVLLLVQEESQIDRDLGFVVGAAGYGLGGAHHLFTYVDKSGGLFERLPVENPLGWPFYRVMTRKAIGGLDASNKGDILAGSYAEWLRTITRSASRSVAGELAGSIVQFKYKKGRIVIVSLDLLEPFWVDPVATIMLHDLIQYCFTPFEPRTALPVQ